MDFDLFSSNDGSDTTGNYNFERKPEERKKEANRAERRHEDSSEHQNIRNKLGLNSNASEGQVRTTLKRFLHKERMWRVLKITKEDFEEWGII